MTSTQITVEDMIGEVVSKNSIAPEQITNFNTFSAKRMWIIILVYR